MFSFSITIASRDRVEYAIKAIDAVLMQTSSEFKFYVSENSENKNSACILIKKYPFINFIKRNNLTSFEHIKTIINECNEDYICILHDDDIILPKFFEEMSKVIQEFDGISAISCNGNIIDEESLIKRDYIFKFHKKFMTVKQDYFKLSYTNVFSLGVAPFPAYFYNTSIAKKIINNFEYPRSKFWDAIFISFFFNYGSVFWNNKKLINYRIHLNNDGRHFSSTDYKYLLNNLHNDNINANLFRVYMFYKSGGFPRIKSTKLKIKISVIMIYIYAGKVCQKFIH